MRKHGSKGLSVFAGILSACCACDRLRDTHRGGSSSEQPPPAPPPASSVPPRGDSKRISVTPKVEPSPEAKALSNAFERAARAIRPCVVRIDVEQSFHTQAAEHQLTPDLPDFLRRFFEFPEELPPGPQGVLHGTGSGLIVDGEGDVLASSHVVRGMAKVTIQLPDQRSFLARVVGTDPLTDVAVIRFEKAPEGLVAARLGDSDKLHIGEWAIAVGSPLGMDQTVTVGVISGVGATGKNFRFTSGERIRRYIQTDAKINPGNSGGPLVNLEGEVVGINTLINVGPGGSYGFAIPINQAWQVAGILIKEGRVRYPYIGVSVMTLTDTLRAELERERKNLPSEGAFVGGVTLNGPAAGAGIAVGDIITRIDGRPIKTADDLVAAISGQRIGSTIKVDYWTGGGTRSVDVKVGEYSAQPGREGNQARIGAALQTLTPPVAESLGLDPALQGAVVTEIVPGSPAQRAGLAVGDVIREIDRRPVRTADEAAAAMRMGPGPRLLLVTNATGTRFVSVTPTS